MSFRSLEALWPEQSALQLRKVLIRRQHRFYKSVLRKKSGSIAWLRRQYYLTNALTDSRRAFGQNEDIALACLIILAVLSFSATSLIENIIYDFMLAASALATVLSANLLILVVLGSGAMTICLIWLMSFIQNALSIALMEGANHKQKKSLRSTLRKSLRCSSKTALAWVGLLLAAFGPASLFLIIAGSILLLLHIKLTASLIVLAAISIACLAWLAVILANYSLVPYVVLFEKPGNWLNALSRSRQLVKSKGRLFIMGGYIALALTMTGLYLLTQLLQKAVSDLSILPFLFVSILVISLYNACLTMFYRKRKLARK